MSLYGEVLNCPDTHCRKKALDKLCKEKIAEGMEAAIKEVIEVAALPTYFSQTTANHIADCIRQVITELEDS